MAPMKKCQVKKQLVPEFDEVGNSPSTASDAAPAKSAVKRKQPPQKSSDCKAAVPAAKRNKNGQATCGRCSVSSSTAAFHVVAGSGSSGDQMVNSTACKRCYDAYSRGWSRMYTWPEVCRRCHSDSSFGESFEKTCKIQAGEAERDFPADFVEGEVVSGYRVVTNMAVLWEKDIPAALGMKRVPPSAKQQLRKLPDSGGGVSSGILIQHPEKPWTEIQLFSETVCRRGTSHLAVGTALLPKQSDTVFKQEKASMQKHWPQGLRGFAKAKTLESLKEGVVAEERARGQGGDSNEDGEDDQEEAEEEELPSDGAGGGGDSDVEAAGAAERPAGAEAVQGDDEAATAAGRIADSAASLSAASLASPACGKSLPPSGSRGRGLDDDDDRRSVVSRDSRAPTSASKLRRCAGRLDLSGVGGKSRVGDFDGETTPPRCKHHIDEMQRVQDLTLALNISDLLDGRAMGDKLYAARRFKPLESACRMKVSKLLRRAEAADQLAIGKLGDLDSATREKLFHQLGPLTAVSVKYAEQVLLIHIKENRRDRVALLGMMNPWREYSSGDDSFNLTTPCLSKVSCSAQMKVEIFEKIVVQHVIVDGIMRGVSAGRDDLLSLCEGLREIAEEKSNIDAYKSLQAHILSFCGAVSILLDPSPTSVSSCKDDVSLVRNMVFGKSVPVGWALVSEAMDEGEGWQELKSDFRRALLSDMTLGKEFAQACDDLREKQLEHAEHIIQKLPGWRTRARRGGTQVLEDALVVELGVQVDALVADTAADGRMESSAKLDQLIIQALSAGLSQSETLKVALMELRKKVRAVSEESLRNIKEVAIMKSLEEYGKEPSSKHLEAVRAVSGDALFLKFVVEEHVSLIREAVVALTEKLASPSAATSDGDSTPPPSKGSIVDDVVLAKSLLSTIHEPSAKDKACLAELNMLESVWSAIAAAGAVQEAEDSADPTSEDHRAHWERLKSLLVTIEAERPAEADASENDTSQKVAAVLENFKSPLDDCRAGLRSFAMNRVGEVAEKVTPIGDKLKTIAGGMFDGTVWKEPCVGGSWEEVLARAQESLFSKTQKGIARQLVAARMELQGALKELETVCEVYDLGGFHREAYDAVATTLKLASVTAVEAKLLQCMKDGGKQSAGTLRMNVQTELDSMIEYRLDSGDIEACIYEKAHEILKT